MDPILLEQQRKEIQRRILERIKGTPDVDVEAIADQSKQDQLVAGLGGALSQLGSAESISRGGPAPDRSFYADMADSAKNRVAEAIKARRLGQDSMLESDKAMYSMDREAAEQDRLAKKADQENKFRQQEIDLKKMSLGAAEAAARNKPVPLSAGDVSKDREIGKEVANYQASGGRKTIDVSLNSLRKLADQLDKNEGLTGGIGQFAIEALPGRTPDMVRKFTSPKVSSMKQDIEKAVLPGLKALFPGATSNVELQTFKELSFDPLLSDKENAEKLRSEIARLQSKADSMDALSNELKAKGTTKDFAPAAVSSYPKKVRDAAGRSATVNSIEEEQEAAAEGFK